MVQTKVNDAILSEYDALFVEVARFAVSNGSISSGLIQRNFLIGYYRSESILAQLEHCGIADQQKGVGPREIFYRDLPSLEVKLHELGLC